jgi:putative transposase
MTIFHGDEDYLAFEGLLRRANERLPLQVLAWCLMPNHFHLVVRPRGDRDLSRWMQWLLTAHVQRYRRRYNSTGRIWQGRFKAPPIQQDTHLLVVMRYVERNPVRAGLVSRAEDWEWSSLTPRLKAQNDILCVPPIALPDDWCGFVNRPQTPAELAEVRTSLHRGSPYGDAAWTRGTAERLELLETLNPRGHPRAIGISE